MNYLLYGKIHVRKQDNNLVPIMLLLASIIVLAVKAYTYSADLNTLSTELVKAQALLN